MTPGVGIGILLTVVLVGVFGLVLAWRHFPKPDPAPANPPIVNEPATGDVARAACEAAHGQWTDCGSPCHGKPSVVCAQVCEPQCLCGGTQGWSCPKELTCTDWEPSQQDPAAIGVCRAGEASVEPEASEASAGAVAREKPAGTICDETNSICVDEDYQDTLLASPFTITGTAIAFEAQFAWRLEDANGEKIEEGSAYGASTPEEPIPPFTIRSFILSVPKTSTGTLVLFEYSAKDGEPIHVLRIPVRLPRTPMAASWYQLAPSKAAEEGTDVCTTFEKTTETIVSTKAPIEASLQVLLKYATMSLDEGMYTMIPRFTKLVSVKLEQGNLSLVFSSEFEGYGGGACNVASIREQIEKTAKQFPSVRNVIISVEGKTPEETLQP